MIVTDEQYMYRCLQLAGLGLGNVAPNPLVGAVLVFDDRIIGEGFHKKYGEAHAEVNCINSVRESDKHLIDKSTLYVSLEPCAHFGKTPPCVDLIIQQKIKKVVIGCKDIFAKVAGKGIEKLKVAGVQLSIGLLEEECKEINKRFFTYHSIRRPYIILKWAQSIDGKIGVNSNERVFISNDFTNRLVHKWRSEESSILVGTHTALKDNPVLTTRLWHGKNPARIVIDKQLQLNTGLHIFNRDSATLIFNTIKNETRDNLEFIKVDGNNLLSEMVAKLFELEIQSVLVEGGTKTIQSFIDAGLYDEVRVIVNKHKVIDDGVEAPELGNLQLIKQENIFGDEVSYYKKV